GKSHFQQIYDRAVVALNNAIAVFNYAENATQELRSQADSLEKFQNGVDDREADFKSRLIEVFGYPYSDDIGAGKTWPAGYGGPDASNDGSVDVWAVTGADAKDVNIIDVPVAVGTAQRPCPSTPCMTGLDTVAPGILTSVLTQVVFHIDTSASKFGEIKPASWGSRRAPGEIQLARSDLIQARGRFEKGLADYDNLLASIQDAADDLQAQQNLSATEINVLNGA